MLNAETINGDDDAVIVITVDRLSPHPVDMHCLAGTQCRPEYHPGRAITDGTHPAVTAIVTRTSTLQLTASPD